MILLLVGIGLTILMVFITRQLMISLPPERFRSVLRLLLPAYLLLNLYFTLLMRKSGEDYPIILTPLHSYFAILGWDIEELSALRQILQGAWNEPAALTLEPLISIIQNIVLFIPFVFLLFGFLLSLSIELCQLLFRLGWFEVDDILHNVLGTYLGIRLYRRTVKRTST